MYSKKYFIILFSSLIFISCSESSINDIDSTENNTITQEVHKLINEHRSSIGKNTLIFNDQIADIALEHTQYMIDKNKISHDNFDARFIEVRNLVNAIAFGENVASRQRNAQEVVTGWLNSPGHRENIEGNYTHTGIGIKKDSKNNYYFTQLFYIK